MIEDLLNLVPAHRGHFAMESGLHGDLWLDLDALFLRPAALRPFVTALAKQLAPHRPQVICGPFSGGAFLAQLIASELEVEYAYSIPTTFEEKLTYRIPRNLRGAVRNKRIALVDDAINAGSAVRLTLEDLLAAEATPVAIAALLTLSSSASEFAQLQQLPLARIGHIDAGLWNAEECPLCAAGETLKIR